MIFLAVSPLHYPNNIRSYPGKISKTPLELLIQSLLSSGFLSNHAVQWFRKGCGRFICPSLLASQFLYCTISSVVLCFPELMITELYAHRCGFHAFASGFLCFAPMRLNALGVLFHIVRPVPWPTFASISTATKQQAGWAGPFQVWRP